jgi:hypothetical protein
MGLQNNVLKWDTQTRKWYTDNWAGLKPDMFSQKQQHRYTTSPVLDTAVFCIHKQDSGSAGLTRRPYFGVRTNQKMLTSLSALLL